MPEPARPVSGISPIYGKIPDERWRVFRNDVGPFNTNLLYALASAQNRSRHALTRGFITLNQSDGKSARITITG
jgi:hypothetical protein